MEVVSKKADEFSAESLAIMVQAGIIPKTAPPEQVAIFQKVCQSKSLSPFLKEIYLVGYGEGDRARYSIIVGIGGFRLIADRTGLLAGIDDTKFDLLPDGVFRTVADFRPGELPRTATVTVWKVVGGQRVPFTHTCRFTEFAPAKGNYPTKWETMPFQMISKAAESHAIRKGFSADVAGLHDEVELPALAGNTIEATATIPAVMKKPVGLQIPENVTAEQFFILLNGVADGQTLKGLFDQLDAEQKADFKHLFIERGKALNLPAKPKKEVPDDATN